MTHMNLTEVVPVYILAVLKINCSSSAHRIVGIGIRIINSSQKMAYYTITTIILWLLWILSRTTWVSWYHKGKTNLDLQEKEIVSGSDICWAICKSAPHPRQTTTTNQFLTGQIPFLQRNQQCQSTEGPSTEGIWPTTIQKKKSGTWYIFIKRHGGMMLNSTWKVLIALKRKHRSKTSEVQE